MKNISFVNLHSHTGFSVNDGLGQPKEHFDFVIQNGMNSMAITEHGHANSYVYAYLASKELNKKGINFKYLPGCEFYIHPDLKQWQIAHENKKLEKTKKKPKKEDEDETATIENEAETKSNKYSDPIKKRNHLVVLAKTSKGLNNLFSLISYGYKDGFYKFPRIDYTLLKQYGEDLIVSSACCGGNLSADVFEEFPGLNFDDLKPSLLNETNIKNILARLENTLDKVVDAVGSENTFIELQFNKLSAQHLANKCFLELSKKTNIKLITTADSHYPTPDHWQDRELYKKIGWMNFNNFEFGKLPESKDELKAELYPKNGNQVWEAYKETTKEYDFYDDDIVLSSIERTHNIAFDVIQEPKPDTNIKLPSWILPKDKDPYEELRKLSFEGLKFRKFDNNQKYIDRLEEELLVIKDKKIENYFLTMKDIISSVENEVLIGHGRGSSASSLVCFCLKITNIDPIKYKLLFSRFINKYRKGMPDIDSDFSDRAKVVDILKAKYGEENVLNISNMNTFKIKSLAKDISRFYQIPFQESNDAIKNIDIDVANGSKKETGEKNINPNFQDAIKYSPNFKAFIDKYPHIAKHIEALYKEIKTVGTHAGGLIISENILNRMPVISSKRRLQTPWSESGNITHLEEMGWIKFDILGVETLAMIEDCIKIILQNKGIKEPTFKQIKEWYDQNLDPNILNLEDEQVYKNVYHEGRFVGVFQYTENPVQSFIKKVKPTCIDDISASTSIFRPGPLGGKVDKVYIENKNDPDLKYDHPLIQECLKDTFNCLVFQEQAMALANIVGNIPLDECDNVRRIISKKPEQTEAYLKQINELQEKFINGAKQNGIDENISKSLFLKTKEFAKYSFNSSHSVSYGILSYQTAYLLTYYTTEWMCGVLNKTKDDDKEKIINMIKSIGYKVDQININKSGTTWQPSEDGKSLIQPLNSIKGFGDKAMEQVMNNRPFNTIEELLFNEKVLYSKLNKKGLDVLIRSGACNDLMDKRFKHLKHFWLSVAFERPKTLKALEMNIQAFMNEEDFTKNEYINNIVSLTGVFPLSLIISDKTLEKLKKKYIPGIGQYDPELDICWFIPRSIEIKKTKNNKNYMVIDVVDDTSKTIKIKCWNMIDKNSVQLNHVYIGKLIYEEQYGFSCKNVKLNFKLIE